MGLFLDRLQHYTIESDNAVEILVAVTCENSLFSAR